MITGDKNFQHTWKYRFGRCPIMVSMFLEKFSVPIENEIMRFHLLLFIEHKLDILEVIILTDCHTHLLTLVAKQDNILYKLRFFGMTFHCHGVSRCTVILVGDTRL